MEENAAVRTRLTHSLEVAHVGRYLVDTVLLKAKRRGLSGSWGIDAERAIAMGLMVETACLLHDIGNPPFGHFGELAICRWFGQKRDKFIRPDGDIDAANYYDDFLNFDGNPQGFRIVAVLAGEDGNTGLNLTATQLASIMKYPIAPDRIDTKNQLTKKAGVFHTEKLIFKEIWEKLGIAAGARHPFAYLMEAADDISYCLSDIEDGIEKKICAWDTFKRQILEESKKASPKAQDILTEVFSSSEKYVDVPGVVAFRSRLIRALVEYAADRYVDRHDEILAGTLPELIFGNDPQGEILGCLKKVVGKLVYSNPLAEIPELTGFSVITGLLDIFEKFLLVDREKFGGIIEGNWRNKGVDVEKRLYDLVAQKHVKAYKTAVEGGISDEMERIYRIHMLLDYITGMTDSFSIGLYRELSGIRN